MASGDCGHNRLVEILFQLHKLGKSGVVRLERAKARKQVILITGRVAFAESNLDDEHLARILVKASQVDRKYLAKVASSMKAGKSSDEAIEETTGLDPWTIEEAAREQATAILASLLSWVGCEPKVYSCEGMPPRRLNLQIPVPQLLVLAARRAASQPLAAVTAPSAQRIVAADEARELMSALPLDSFELYAYAQAQSPHSVDELIRLLPGGSVKPVELLLRLLILGLVKPESRTESARAAAASNQAMAALGHEMDEMVARFEVANFYQILSVPTDASEDLVHGAYHDLARQYHPDRFESKAYDPGLRSKAEYLFTFITGAYTTLSNPAARANYDEMRKVKESQVEATLQGRASTDIETEKMAEALFRAGCTALASNELETAIRHLKECVWLRADVAKYHHYLGVAQGGIARYLKEAEQHLLRSLELDSMRVESRLELAKIYIRVNLPKRAEAQLLQALRWDPGNKTARRLLDEIAKLQSGGAEGTRRLKVPSTR